MLIEFSETNISLIYDLWLHDFVLLLLPYSLVQMGAELDHLPFLQWIVGLPNNSNGG